MYTLTRATLGSSKLFVAVFLGVSAPVIAVANTDTAQPKLHELLLNQKRAQTEVVTRSLAKLDPTAPVYNREAVIPPQCYTRTEGQFNPCYVCHQNPLPDRENTMADGELQLAYSFSDVGMTNHWKNLFDDRTEGVAAISDEEIDKWVGQDNYSELAPRLQAAGFRGWIPDLANLHKGAGAFDNEGFALDGSHWVAFNYKPLPSTFWPTNGSTDDVMIRLPASYRQDAKGRYSREIYKANLAIAEALLKGLDSISSLPIDEQKVGRDLNEDNAMTTVNQVSALDQYVGAAEQALTDTFVYPAGTEFLHTVRYVGVADNGDITVPARMKEVRYMKKWQARHKMTYQRGYQLEAYAKQEGRLPWYPVLGERGLDNEFAWSVQSFIEARDGRLRTASYEENLFCMGCHSSIGSTIDKTFAFPRKVDGAAGWGYINLKGMADAPNRGETKGEIATYLERVGGGGEFRSNPEMQSRWFDANGRADQQRIAKARDVYELITPSAARARELNKAYRLIVQDQDYIYGRDATVKPPENVYKHIDNATAPTLPAEFFVNWDIRLDWSALANHQGAEKNSGSVLAGSKLFTESSLK